MMKKWPRIFTSVQLDATFLHFARTMDATGIKLKRRNIIEAPFVTPNTITVSKTGAEWKVLVPVGFKPPVPYPQMVMAAVRPTQRSIVTVNDEVKVLRQVILQAFKAQTPCPFCRFEPCVDMCVVNKIKQGEWVAATRMQYGE